MPDIVSIHSFRGGTGKSNLTANIAATAARRGRRVGIVDTDVQSPGIHILFGLDESRVTRTLNDYLWGQCPIEEAAYDVSEALRSRATESESNAIFLIPSSLKAREIARVLREGYEVSSLNDGFREIIERLELDCLFIDTHPGVNEETLLSIAISDALLIVMRPDQQDYQGTAVTVELARKLEVPHMRLVVNKLLPGSDVEAVRRQVESAYGVPVAGVLPLAEEMVRLGSSDLFCLRFPEHPFTHELEKIADAILSLVGEG